MIKKRMTKNNLFIFIGILLIFISIIHFCYSEIKIRENKKRIEREKIKFLDSIKNNEDKLFREQCLIPKNKEFLKSTVEEKEVELDRKKYPFKSTEIGYIEIDKIDIVLPIFEGSAESSLKQGVGLLDQTDYPSYLNNSISVLAGHRGGSNGQQSFLNIDKLNNNDLITITTTNGVLTYKIVKKEVVENTDWSKFTREENISKLILMSCHPYPKNNKRLLVISELIEFEEFN